MKPAVLMARGPTDLAPGSCPVTARGEPAGRLVIGAASLPEMSRVLRYGLLFAIALSGVLLFILASASGNTAFFEKHYPVLLAVNGVIAAALAVLVLVLVRRLIKRLRLKRFGARLTTRFAVAFALMGLLPGVLIYIVSTQFLARSIESWFDVRVDRALESGLTLGRAALDNLKSDVTAKARAWALELADVPESTQLVQLNRLREQAGISEALLVGASGQLIGASGAQVSELVPEIPKPGELRQARMQRLFAVIEGEPGAAEERQGLRTRVIVPIPAPAAAAAGGSLLPLVDLPVVACAMRWEARVRMCSPRAWRAAPTSASCSSSSRCRRRSPRMPRRCKTATATTRSCRCHAAD